MKFYKLIFFLFIVIFLIGFIISNSMAGNEKLSAPNNLVAWQSGEYIQLRYDFDYEEQYEYNIYRSPNLDGEWEKLNFIPFPLSTFVDYNPLIYETSYYKVVRIDYYGNESFPSIIKVQYDLTKIGICIKGIFDKNNIISDQQLINFSSMSLWDIQNFLSNHGSYLAIYYFEGRSAAQHIYDACQEHQINPQVVLTTLQKEQGLITSSTATQAQLNYAMGWDGSSDFGTQIYWGTKQFRRYYDNLESYGWSVGEPHTVNDGVIAPANIATAGLYIYTPWIGEGGGGAYGVGGNYLFWDLWYNDFGFNSSPKFNIGDYVEVFNVGVTGLNVRSTPCGDPPIGKKYDGDIGQILDGPIYCDNYNRWLIRWSEDGLEGWSAEDWLKKSSFPYIVPPTVTTLPADNITTTSARLHGSINDTGGEDPSDAGFGYRLKSGGPETVVKYGVGNYYADLTGLAPGTTYEFRFWAENSAGRTYGSYLSFTTLPVIVPPTGIQASDGTYTDKVRITWNSVSGASYYRVYRATSSGGSKTALGSWQSSTSYDDTSATPGQTYYYFVKAATSSSGSNASDYSSYNTGFCSVTPTRIIRLEGDLNFGDVQVGDSAQRTLTIYNDGNSTLTVSGINYPTGFSGNWSGPISAGGSHSVPVTFSPTQPITYSGTLTVNSDKTGGTNTKSLSGTGTSTPTIGIVQLLSPSNGATLPPGNITFSWNSVSNATKYQFILYNSQGQVALDATNSSTSSIITLGTEETITWKVRAGDNSGNWGAWSSTWSLTLKSTTCIIRLEGDLNFGDVQVGDSAQRTLTIYNDGNSTLTVYGINCPAGFSGNWSGTISAGSSRNVTVTFAPTQAILYSGTLTVNSDATSGTNTKSVSGTGVPPTYPLANLELTPSTQSVTVGNQATINVVVEDVTNLKGANITLNFDASKLQYTSSADGGFIPSATLLEQSIDNINGSVTLDIASLTESASGTGTIITVVFERIATGNTNITFGTTELRDEYNNTIVHTTGSGCSFSSCLGDFGGPSGYPDGVIDFEDLMIFALAYGSSSGDPNWNPVCDIAGPNGSTIPDGVIDFEDLMIFAMNYGKICADL